MSLMHQAGVQSANQLGLSWVEHFDDFMGSTVAAAVDVSAWDITLDAVSGSTAAITLPDTGTSGELLLFGSTATDVLSCQLNGSTVAMAAGKKLIFETRLKVENVTTDTDELFGLCEVSVLPLLTTGLPLDADFVGFNKVGASADVDIITQTATAAATITTGVASFVADTYAIYRFEWDGISKVRFFVDGAKVGEHSTNLPTTTTLMKPTYALQTIDAGAADFDFTVDYSYLAVQR